MTSSELARTDSGSRLMSSDEFWRDEDRVRVVKCAGTTLEGIIELQLGPSVFVVLHQQHGLADDGAYRALSVIWQSIEQTRREGSQDDGIARFGDVHSSHHTAGVPWQVGIRFKHARESVNFKADTTPRRLPLGDGDTLFDPPFE